MGAVAIAAALLLAVAACSQPDTRQSGASAATATPAPAGGPDTIVLTIADTAEYPAANDSLGLSAEYAADVYLHSVEARLASNTLQMERFLRTANGLVPVPDTSATTTDVGIIRDSAGVITGAVVGIRPYPAASFNEYMFDASGRTTAFEYTYDDGENGCTDIVHVSIRWVLAGNRVVSRSRKLLGPDDEELNTFKCLVGMDTQQTAFTSWPALARSIGWKQ